MSDLIDNLTYLKCLCELNNLNVTLSTLYNEIRSYEVVIDKALFEWDIEECDNFYYCVLVDRLKGGYNAFKND